MYHTRQMQGIEQPDALPSPVRLEPLKPKTRELKDLIRERVQLARSVGK